MELQASRNMSVLGALPRVTECERGELSFGLDKGKSRKGTQAKAERTLSRTKVGKSPENKRKHTVGNLGQRGEGAMHISADVEVKGIERKRRRE